MFEELSIVLDVFKKAPRAGIKLFTESAIFKNKNIKTKFLKIDELEVIVTIKLINNKKDNT
tara:strand:- start:330 stop:512 length:183 start_codon:yes stop_codon:yes gene_type:complete